MHVVYVIDDVNGVSCVELLVKPRVVNEDMLLVEFRSKFLERFDGRGAN